MEVMWPIETHTTRKSWGQTSGPKSALKSKVISKGTLVLSTQEASDMMKNMVTEAFVHNSEKPFACPSPLVSKGNG